MHAEFERFTLQLTKKQAMQGSHPCRCDDDVAYLCGLPEIASQLRSISDDALRAELNEYGAWDADELADRKGNEKRIVWQACCMITEQSAERKNHPERFKR